ncbi:MAG: endolytic transglycosylase MltG [Lachnospiraceae bacterium]|nr:endolytic transglycosylase MltG [Lachnospiraceae bacterium]
MRLKYFLRGLGMGILLTSVIFYVAYWQSQPADLTDAQIRQRAKELGMVEKENPVGNLLPAKEDSSEDDTPVSAQDMLTEQGTADASTSEEIPMNQTEEPAVSETTAPDKADSGSAQEKTTEAESQTQEETPAASDTVSITIKGGDSSMTICQTLQKAGLIENASEFDTYLIENGYASRIRAGTYNLKTGMSFQNLADAISQSAKR